MSGHNPHGRSLGQPNSSWNHLQVPSYIPRQPQLAHMSNERQIVRSPPTWHTPTPSDSLFSFMPASNHKVPLDSGIIKPLIPPFAAPNMPPFGSVDLSITAARNSLTPSPRSLHSPGVTSNISSPPPEFSSIIKNNPNSGMNRNLSPTPGVIQTAASVKEKQHRTSSSPSLMLNNGDLNSAGLFIRDAKQINNDLVKITREPIGLPPMSEPVELVKEAIFHSMINHSISISPTRSDNRLGEPIPIAVSSPASPDDIQSLHQVNQENSMNVIQSVNSQSPSYNCKSTTIVSPPTATVPSNTISASASIIQPPISPPSNNLSEDSIDSNGSKKRRKRKPNKTIRVSSDSNDNNSTLENNFSINSITVSQNNTLLDDSIVIGTELVKTDHPPIVPQCDDKITDISPVDTYLQKPSSQSQQQTTIINSSSPSLSMLSTVSKSAPSNDKVLFNTNSDNTSNNNNENSKHDADECETIDKIAEMIAKTDKNKEILLSLSTTNKESSQTDDADLEKTLNGTISCDNNNMITENTNSFEDVENKLEEMFAGIVDDRPPPLPSSSQPTQLRPTPPKTSASSISSTITNVIQTSAVTVTDKDDTADDKSNNEREVGETLNSSGVIEDLKILGLNNTTDDDDKQENSGDNNNIKTNEIKLTENDTDDTSTKLVNNSSINSIRNVKNNNNSSSNNNSNSKGTKRGKLDDNSNLGDPINKKKKKNNSNTSSSSSVGVAGTTTTPKTIKNKTKLNNNKTKSSAIKSKSSTSSSTSFNRKLTDLDYNDRDDVSSNNITNNSKNFRGPFVHVRPDGDIAVINAPNIDEDTEKSQNKLKKITGPSSSERNQIRGLHVSTLSMKYDADTRDTSWICVFCKIGPHKNGLGDLFGPYILTTTCDEFQLSQMDPAEDFFKSKRTKHDMIQKFIGGKRVDVPSPNGGGTSNNIKKKKKPNLDSSTSTTTHEIKTETSEINVYDGMSKAGENSYEIWTHEDCVVWAPGVHIIGSRIVGLEAAVWCSSRHKCVICLKYGAMLSCLYRGCSLEVHVPCAKQNNWSLNDNDFKCYCEKHKIALNLQT